MKKLIIKLQAKDPEYKGCLMISLDISNWDHYINTLIDPEDIDELEDTPHLTLLYGFNETQSNYKDKMNHSMTKYNRILKNHKLKVIGLSIFENDENDVLKFDIELDPILYKIRKELESDHDWYSEYKDYVPHVTLAYLKKGTGNKYIDPDIRFYLTCEKLFT